MVEILALAPRENAISEDNFDIIFFPSNSAVKFVERLKEFRRAMASRSVSAHCPHSISYWLYASTRSPLS